MRDKNIFGLYETSSSGDYKTDKDGYDPDKESGPVDCQVGLERTAFESGDVQDVANSAWEVQEQFHEQFPVEEIPVIMDRDGLPTIVTPPKEENYATPFTYDCVCLEDDREFEEIFYEDIETCHVLDFSSGNIRFTKKEASFRLNDKEMISLWEKGDAYNPLVAQSRHNNPIKFTISMVTRDQTWSKFPPNHVYSVMLLLLVRSKWNLDGSLAKPLMIKKPLLQEKFGKFWFELPVPDEAGLPNGMHLVNGYVPFRPKRERCKFYKRQVFAHDNIPDKDAPGHQIVFRVCSQRRSNGGSFMSLSNETCYACDLREPPDFESVAIQDKKDLEKLVSEPHKTMVPIFGMKESG